MLEEYALVPDIFDPAAYSNPAYTDMCLAHLKEPLLHEALVRDLCDGSWSTYCTGNVDHYHRLAREILRKLSSANRLCRCPRYGHNHEPRLAVEWCEEALASHATLPLSGVIAGHATKAIEAFSHTQEICSVEKLAGTAWFQNRSPTRLVDRKPDEYLKLMARISLQANSFMFIDPNLDPSQYNYQDFYKLLLPFRAKNPRPTIELHRSSRRGDGPTATFPGAGEWRQLFGPLGEQLQRAGLSAEVFLWEDFHDRYLITDIVGITVGAGFDVTARAQDMTIWARLGRHERDEVQRRYDPAASGGRLKGRFSIGR